MAQNESTPTPTPAPVDGPTERLRAVRTHVSRCSLRPHRAKAGELAALAFAPPHAIPAQRRPDPIEFRPAS